MHLVKPLAAVFALATVALAGCSAKSNDGSSTTSDSAFTENEAATPNAACSLRYWGWVLDELEPQLEKSIAEVSDEQMTALVAMHPPMEETRNTYSACWTPVFDKYVYAAGVGALHQADVDFVFQGGPGYRDYARYKAKVAMTPELRRNAKALPALKPEAMTATDTSTWMNAYSDALAEVIHPVGVPGLMMYEDVVEPEWVITDDEAEYLTLFENAGAKPSKDGVYSEWMPYFSKWVFGPPPVVTRSFVFNVVWEPAYGSDSFGLSGLVVDNSGTPYLPAPVQSFIARLKSTMPAPLGSDDSAGWMIPYHGRFLRALGDLSQSEPLLTKTDTLALDVLEGVKPAQLRGAFTYETWLDGAVLAAGQSDASWSTRIGGLEPCLDAPDLAGAQDKFTTKTAPLTNNTIPAPHACAN